MEEADERTPALAPATTASARSGSPRRVPLFERASARWWNPQFRSVLLEEQYWKCAFPLLRDRFRAGLVYIAFVVVAWTFYLFLNNRAFLHNWLTAAALTAICLLMLFFTLYSHHYERFYMPTSFLCVFLVCVVSLVVFSDGQSSFMSPVATLTTSIQVVLLIYTVIPLPLYLCIVIGLIYSGLFQVLSHNRSEFDDYGYLKILIHLGAHLLGVHLFILTQVRQRKTFLKVGQSILAKRDLELETTFKDNMIQSVMPKKVADELLKDATDMRRPSASNTSNCRTSNATAIEATLPQSVPETRKFRPFTMNMMNDVSILFADIAGFTKMSSNKSADELVNLLNDLFQRFDKLCQWCSLEKISTLGDCYYCVAGCPEPRADHAKCCVEMGLEMIVAIAQFDIDRGQEVNMRVGIHTGKVMCGMVGTKRFKFDVFSNDVTLANEMESSGQAGRVHISEATASFLGNQYILEEDKVYKGMKTYFIVERAGEAAEATMERETPAIPKQISFRKKIAERLKGSTPTPAGGPHQPHPLRATNSTGGSLRMGLADRNSGSVKEQNGDHAKSVSMQALATSNGASTPDRWQPGAKRSTAGWQADSSSAGSGGRGSGGRGSGQLQASVSRCELVEQLVDQLVERDERISLQEACSEMGSLGGLDTAISHHHNAASLTRFDTDNKDFDQRLAALIQESGRGVDKGFWVHQNSLNPWTLKFNEKEVEEEYRKHFGDSSDRYAQTQTNQIAHHQRMASTDEPPPSRYRYSGVFIDVLVATMLFVLTSVLVFLSLRPLPTAFLLYFAAASTIVLLAIGLIAVPVLSQKSLIACLSLWQPRHMIGAVLIALPVGVALSFAPLCQSPECITSHHISVRLLFSYIMICALFAHCNFSQLAAWPKTIQCAVVGALHIAVVWYCQRNVDAYEPSLAANCSTGEHALMHGGFGAPLFDHEILLDVILSVILVGFLNYQFEAAFRMSFFGDVQARRDTERMQVVRDQADWLLTNVIPQHAVEKLKSDTKYSENHDLTCVMFGTITNWTDMYEENFEGGREFLRVLNEVIGDFDELLERPEFAQVEKIKTIGACYMAASGLNPEKRRNATDEKEHLYQMIEFALALQSALYTFNEDLLNFDFVCKLGVNIGPVTAGVIGTTKLYYDIWGDTVNIASRMYSTGVENRIQVSQHTRDLLSDRYVFEYRDHIEVKGIDGGMDTYLLVGRVGEPPLPIAKPSDDFFHK